MLSLDQAQKKIVETLHPVSEESIPFSNCQSRILSRDIVAKRKLPPFNNSAMDGYALRSEDTSTATKQKPVHLKVTQTIAAGSRPSRSLKRGEAFRIYTGAMVPQGSDAVILQENTEREDDVVSIYEKATPKQHIRFQGEDVELGTSVLEKGTKIGPGELAMLAAQGQLDIPVHRKPRVAILPTGNEIKPLNHKLEPGQIPNSNSHMLAAQVELCGAIALQQPIAPDAPEALATCLKQAAKEADLILTCGGVSVGDFDFITSIVGKEGTLDFWKVAIKPGKPLVYGRIFDVPILGLPGNPVSSFVTFELFARPAILKLSGSTSHFEPQTQAKLTHPVQLNKTREQFIRATITSNQDGYFITATTKQGSGQLSSMVNINALARIPTGAGMLNSGTVVTAIYLPK